MRVFLTGGTGFLGRRLMVRLAERGHEVVALVRRRPVDTPSMPAGVQVVTGDIVDPEAVLAGAEGAEAIVHTAAMVKMWAPDRSAFDRVNIDGLRNILDAARRLGVPRTVYTSSFIALGPTDGRVADESQTHPGGARNDYERTKAAADRVAREAARAGASLVILYPGVIYGAGELTDGSLMTRTIRDFMRGRVPYLGSGDQRVCYAFIDDVVDGHLRALERGRIGRGYILGGENADYHRLFRLLERVTGTAAPRLHVPFWTMSLVGRALRWRANLMGIEPWMTDEVIRIYRHDWAYSSDRATRELGYRITPLEEGLRRTVDWLRTRAA